MAHREPAGESEPVLVVAPALVQPCFNELRSAGFVGRHWHPEGRYGSRIGAVADEEGLPGGRRGLPILPTAAESISEYISTGACGTAAAHIPSLITRGLTTGDIELRWLPITKPRLPKAEEVDGTIHPERALHGAVAGVTDAQAFLSSVASDAAARRQAGGSFNFAELFAGIGGFRIGLEALGGRCVFASEIDSRCMDVYRRNFCSLRGDDQRNINSSCSEVLAGDIWEVENDSIPPHDILVGGFPCQPFSTLGEQPGLGDEKGGFRGMLFTQIVRILVARQPSAFILENVPGLLHCDGGEALKSILEALRGAGYRVTHELVNARCLTAQSRNRLFIVGLLGEDGPRFEFPFIPDLCLRCSDILDDESELHARDPEALDAFTLTEAQFEALRGNKVWQPSKLAWPDKVAATLDSHYSVSVSKGASQLVPRNAPHRPRRFTPIECARLMGFPAETLELGGPEPGQGFNAWFKARYRMLGNAICPPVVAAIGGAVMAQITGVKGLHQQGSPMASVSPAPDSCELHRHVPAELLVPTDWETTGRAAALKLALDAVVPHRRPAVLKRLCLQRSHGLGAGAATEENAEEKTRNDEPPIR